MDLTPHALAGEFIIRFKTQCPDVEFVFTDTADPVVTIPEAHPAVGSMTIWFDGEEVTVGIGRHFHCHFDLVRYEPEKDFVKDLALLRQAIDWIRSFLDDEIILEICKVNGEYSGAATYPTTRFNDRKVPAHAELYTWSGPWNGAGAASASNH